MNLPQGHEKKTNSGQIIGGIIVTGIGILFLLVNLGIIPGLEDTWPVFIIIVGLALIVGSMRKRGKKDVNEGM
ncbi:MAG: DUF5668 domain-containing protein [Candidatus Zixiibacteriota bacterium]